MIVELANKIGRVNGRLCAIGNEYVVTRRNETPSNTAILARFDTREAAEAWIAQSSPVPRKETLYRTARAIISCAQFQAGAIVSVQHYWLDVRGIDWYLITRSDRGLLDSPVAYPANHLTDFVL